MAASVAAEPMDIDNRFRNQAGQPVGMKNVGNTCYFNSLIQTLFWMPNIKQKVLRAQFGEPEMPQSGKQFSMKELRK